MDLLIDIHLRSGHRGLYICFIRHPLTFYPTYKFVFLMNQELFAARLVALADLGETRRCRINTRNWYCTFFLPQYIAETQEEELQTYQKAMTSVKGYEALTSVKGKPLSSVSSHYSSGIRHISAFAPKERDLDSGGKLTFSWLDSVLVCID